MRTRHQEVIDRIEYMYKDIDNNINFPDSFDGDVLKIAYESAKASLIQMTNGRQRVIKIGRYYYVDDYNTKTSLTLSLNIQNARWFDSSLQHHKEKMDVICLDYGGEVRDLLDELQSSLMEEPE